jgi:adenylate cyclase
MPKVKFPISYKLALVMILLIGTGMSLLGTLIIHNQNKLLENQMHAYAAILIQELRASAKEILLTSDKLGLNTLLNEITQGPEIPGAAFYSDEKRLLGYEGHIPPLPNFPDDKEILRHYWKHSELAKNEKFLSYIAIVPYKDITLGYVQLTYDQSLLRLARQQTLYTIIIITAILLIFSILLSLWVGNRLSMPIKELVHASNAITNGHYDIHINEQRNDELGVLMHSVKVMADGLFRKQQVEKAFSRYLSPNVAKKVLNDLDFAKLGGEQVEASVLFVDIIGFTDLSKELSSEALSQLLNHYFSYINQAAHIYSGHVDKYIGDCAMLVFGVPKHDKLHAYQAVACALLIQQLIRKLNTQRIAKNQPIANFHIATNSGLMLAGNMGSNQRMEYTVIGDAVNLASQLAGYSLNNEIIVPETMLEYPGITNYFIYKFNKAVTFPGQKNIINLYNIVSFTQPFQSNLTTNLEKLLNHDFNDVN